MRIEIENSHGIVAIPCTSTDFVATVKRKYGAIEGFFGNPNFIPLAFNGVLLDDIRQLRDYGIRNASRLQHLNEEAVLRTILMARRSTGVVASSSPSSSVVAQSTTPLSRGGGIRTPSSLKPSSYPSVTVPRIDYNALATMLEQASGLTANTYDTNVDENDEENDEMTMMTNDDNEEEKLSMASSIEPSETKPGKDWETYPPVLLGLAYGGVADELITEDTENARTMVQIPISYLMNNNQGTTSMIMNNTDTTSTIPIPIPIPIPSNNHIPPAVSVPGINPDIRDRQAHIRAQQRAKVALVPVLSPNQLEMELLPDHKGIPSSVPPKVSLSSSLLRNPALRTFENRYVCTVPTASLTGHGHTFSLLPRMEGRWSGTMEQLFLSGRVGTVDTVPRAVSTTLIWDGSRRVWREMQLLTTPDGIATETHLTLVPVEHGTCSIELGTNTGISSNSTIAGAPTGSSKTKTTTGNPSLYHHHFMSHTSIGHDGIVATLREVGPPGALSDGVLGVLILTAASASTGLPILVETTVLVSDMTRIRTVQRFSSDGSLSAIYTLREARVLDTLTGALEKVYVPMTTGVTGTRRSTGRSTAVPSSVSIASDRPQPVVRDDERLRELINAFRSTQRANTSGGISSSNTTNTDSVTGNRRKGRLSIVHPAIIPVDVTDIPLADPSSSSASLRPVNSTTTAPTGEN